MAAIKVSNYQNISIFYAQAQVQVAGVADYYYSAAFEIVALAEFDPELDLLSPFWNAYLAVQTIYLEPPQAVISAVRSLQGHILSKALTTAGDRFTDVNDWLDANNQYSVAGSVLGRDDDIDGSIQVDTEFATLSATAGYTLNAALIVA